jgi:hypothetical protein
VILLVTGAFTEKQGNGFNCGTGIHEYPKMAPPVQRS